MSNKYYQQKIREFRKMHSELIHTIYINSLEKAREYYDKKLSTIDTDKLQFVSNNTAYLYDENNNKIFAEILEDGELCYYEWFDQFGRVVYKKRYENDGTFSDCLFIYDKKSELQKVKTLGVKTKYPQQIICDYEELKRKI